MSSDALYERTLTANDEIGELAVKISLARGIRDHLRTAAKNFDPLPSTTALGNGGVETQILNYNNELVQRNLMVQNSSEDNPLVQDRDYQLSLARQNILSAVDGYISSLDAQMKPSNPNCHRLHLACRAARRRQNTSLTKSASRK